MSKIDPTRHPPDQAQIVQHANELLDWFESWNDAWAWCDDQGQCDTIFGHEYRRVIGQALIDGVPNSQAAMRSYIFAQCGLGPMDSITRASLAAREAKRNQHTQEG